MRMAKTKTPMSQEAVMKRSSRLLLGLGFLFLPIDVAVLVAK